MGARETSTGMLLGMLLLATTAHAQKAPASKPPIAEQCAGAAEHGQLLRMQGKLKDARLEFLSCTKTACPLLVRKDCNEYVAEIDRLLPSVTIVVRDASGNDIADAQIAIDGAPIEERVGQSVQLDPGPHALHIVTAHGTIDKTVVVQEGDKMRRIEVALPAAVTLDRPRKDEAPATSVGSMLAWPLVGAGVVGVGVGAYFAVAQAGSYADGKSCPLEAQPQCGRDAKSTVDRERLFEGIFFGIGGAALVGGVVLLLTRSPARAATAARLRWDF